MGGGDVKLLAMVGAFVGPTIGIEIELYAFVLTALFAGARLAYQGQLLKVLANSALLVTNPLRSKDRRRRAARRALDLVEIRAGGIGVHATFDGLRLGLLRCSRAVMTAHHRKSNPSRQLFVDCHGAVFVEHLIVFLPLMFFFLATLQTIELCTG